MSLKRKTLWVQLLAELAELPELASVSFGLIEPTKTARPAAAVIPLQDDKQNRASKTHDISDLQFAVRVVVDDSGGDQAGLLIEEAFEAIDARIRNNNTMNGTAQQIIKGRTTWLYNAPDFPQAGADQQYTATYAV